MVSICFNSWEPRNHSLPGPAAKRPRCDDEAAQVDDVRLRSRLRKRKQRQKKRRT